MEFSDESDNEANTQEESNNKKRGPSKRSSSQKAVENIKSAPGPPVEKVVPKRVTRGRKTTAVLRTSSSDDDEALVCRAASTRRGRTRRELSRAEANSMEPDKMRTIDEETNEVLDISIEQLRGSDAETEDNPSLNSNIGEYLVHIVKLPLISKYFSLSFKK